MKKVLMVLFVLILFVACGQLPKFQEGQKVCLENKPKVTGIIIKINDPNRERFFKDTKIRPTYMVRLDSDLITREFLESELSYSN